MAKGQGTKHGLSIRQYAAHRKAEGLPGRAVSTVQKMLERGVIKRNTYGKIDPVTADVDWMENTNRSMSREKPATGAAPDDLDGAGGSSASVYAKSRAARETFAAKREQLLYLQLAGRLVDRDLLAEELFSLGRAWRDRMLALVGRYQGKIPKKYVSQLEDEIRDAVEEVTRGPRSIQ